jgi:prevent-host-death family protein
MPKTNASTLSIRAVIVDGTLFFAQLNVQQGSWSMKQLLLTQARAKLSELVAEADSGKGPVAIAQRSKIKVVLVNAEWHSRVEEEFAYYRCAANLSRSKDWETLDCASHHRARRDGAFD